MTIRRAVTTARADEDIDHAIDFCASEGAPDAALDLVDELEAIVLRIRRHPSIGSTRFAAESGVPDLRSMALRSFPYVVFYTDDADAVRVHRVLHSSRDIPARLLGD